MGNDSLCRVSKALKIYLQLIGLTVNIPAYDRNIVEMNNSVTTSLIASPRKSMILSSFDMFLINLVWLPFDIVFIVLFHLVLLF